MKFTRAFCAASFMLNSAAALTPTTDTAQASSSLAAAITAMVLMPTATNAMNFGNIFKKKKTHDESAAPASFANDELPSNRELLGNCWGDSTPDAAWHPQYSLGWTEGYCRYTVDCNSPSYSTELSCCKAAYAGQVSGKCLRQLPNPPTSSPTGEGGLDIYYPDYNTAWTEATCINDAPMPSGRPAYTTMLACCKGAYGGQMSGKCLAALQSPPTTSPTPAGGLADFWYPDYDTAWNEAGCLNTFPLPYDNVNDRPNYSTQLVCCKGAYGGQMSGKCLAQLPSPPTTSPTGSGGLDFYYPDYDIAWSEATCKNDAPLPFANKNDRPTYDSKEACCKGSYSGQVSHACMCDADPCYSCTCGDAAYLFLNKCILDCGDDSYAIISGALLVSGIPDPIPTNPGELQAILDMVGSEIMVRIQNLLDQGLTVTQVLVTSIGDTQVGRRGLRRLAAVSTKYNAFITGNNVKDDLDTNQVTTSASSTALVISVPSMSPTPKPTNNPSPSPIKAPSTTPTVTPTNNPSSSPSKAPSTTPTVAPTSSPTETPPIVVLGTSTVETGPMINPSTFASKDGCNSLSQTSTFYTSVPMGSMCPHVAWPFWINSQVDDGASFIFEVIADAPLGTGGVCGNAGATAGAYTSVEYWGGPDAADAVINTPLEELDSISYDFYVKGCQDSNTACPEQFYLNVYVRTSDTSAQWMDCNFAFVPSEGGEESTWTSKVLDDIKDQTAAVVFSLDANTYDCAAAHTTLQSFLDANSGAVIGVNFGVHGLPESGYGFVFNIGDTADKSGLEGCFDNIKISFTGGSSTYDFEPSISN